MNYALVFLAFIFVLGIVYVVVAVAQKNKWDWVQKLFESKAVTKSAAAAASSASKPALTPKQLEFQKCNGCKSQTSWDGWNSKSCSQCLDSSFIKEDPRLLKDLKDMFDRFAKTEATNISRREMFQMCRVFGFESRQVTCEQLASMPAVLQQALGVDPSMTVSKGETCFTGFVESDAKNSGILPYKKCVNPASLPVDMKNNDGCETGSKRYPLWNTTEFPTQWPCQNLVAEKADCPVGWESTGNGGCRYVASSGNAPLQCPPGWSKQPNGVCKWDGQTNQLNMSGLEAYANRARYNDKTSNFTCKDLAQVDTALQPARFGLKPNEVVYPNQNCWNGTSCVDANSCAWTKFLGEQTAMFTGQPCRSKLCRDYIAKLVPSVSTLNLTGKQKQEWAKEYLSFAEGSALWPGLDECPESVLNIKDGDTLALGALSDAEKQQLKKSCKLDWKIASNSSVRPGVTPNVRVRCPTGLVESNINYRLRFAQACPHNMRFIPTEKMLRRYAKVLPKFQVGEFFKLCFGKPGEEGFKDMCANLSVCPQGGDGCFTSPAQIQAVKKVTGMVSVADDQLPLPKYYSSNKSFQGGGFYWEPQPHQTVMWSNE